MEDLICGILPVDANELSAEEAWDICYQHMAEFVDVVFSQFKDRFRDHRKVMGANATRADFESAALARDRLLFPWQTENHRGEPVFDLHPAKHLLRDDVKEGRHREMTPTQLQNYREEYKEFKAEKCKHQIYQEIRRQKFINYLNERRSQGFF
jgi:hypothetical protein